MLGVVGDLVEDIVVWLNGPIQHATDSDAAVHRTRGGSAANVAAFAARTHPTRFLGCVGADAIGDWLVDDLTRDGVEVQVQRRESTGTVVVLVDEHGERTMFPHRGAATMLSDIPESWTRDLRHLHVPAYSFSGGPIADTSRTLVRRMLADQATVSVDASSTGLLRTFGTARFLALLSELRVPLLLANRAEATYLGLIEGHQPGPSLADIPHTWVVVKDGADPTTVMRHHQSPLRVAVPPVDGTKDLTGAGDAFAAGFLTAFLDGAADLGECCEAGHASAARVLRAPGATATSDGRNP